jgi:hypothetical protein
MIVDGKVTFTPEEQVEIDRVIGERLSREKAKYADHEEIVSILDDFDYAGMTAAEKKVLLRQNADAYKTAKAERQKEEELEALMDQAKHDGTTPQLLAKIDRLEKQLSEVLGERQAIKQAEEMQKQTQARFVNEVQEFQGNEKYKGVDLDKLLKDEDFSEFYQSSNPGLSISQVYDKYVKYVGGAEAAAMAKFKANADRSTASGKQRGDAGGTYGLTAAQIELVDQFNRENPKMKMTYKQYAERL